jgi:hypothetical protein
MALLPRASWTLSPHSVRKAPTTHNVFVLTHASAALHPPHPPSPVFVPTEKMHNDDDKAIRRKVHNVLTHYRKTGKWNIL